MTNATNYDIQIPDKNLNEMTVKELHKWAHYYGLENFSKLNKADLVTTLKPLVQEAADKQSMKYFEEQEKKRNAPAAASAPAEAQEVRMVQATGNKSDQMRKLHEQGATVAQIAKELDANYSFVYSVIKKFKEEGAPHRSVEGSKSEQMRMLFDQGKSVATIAKELDVNYAFAYGVIRRYKMEKEGNN